MQSFFVSSTFKDMQGERDALHRLVMPRLREKAKNYGENIQFVDLRWGISTADMDSDAGAGKILGVCLAEVRQCQPYMIVLLGERYGWMPSPELLRQTAADANFSAESYEMSVTELEIQYSLWLSENQLDHFVFCLRDPVPAEELSDEQRSVYLPGSEEDRARMQRLRDKITGTPGATVLRYGLDWDAEARDFSGYDRFAGQLADVLEKNLSQQWAARQELSWQERQREDDRLIIDIHQSSFVGRSRELAEIMSVMENHQVVILEGEGGCGKSALMAQLLRLQREKGISAELFCCGNSTSCMSVMQLTRLMCWQMDRIESMEQEKNKIPDWKACYQRLVGSANRKAEPSGNGEENGTDMDWKERYQQKMASYDGPPLVFFLDAIDQFSPDQALYESWFIPPVISAKVRFVISTTGAVRVNPIALPTGKKGASSLIIKLSAPDETELREILNARFHAEHKQISRKVADKILENPCSKNMLGMEIMVRRLVMLGQKDFREIAVLEQTMDSAAAIEAYLLRLTEQMSQSLNQLIIDYFDTICEFLDEKRYQCMQLPLYIIATMQHGFSPDQFERLAHSIWTDTGFAGIPEDHIWRNFWDPILFSQMKRYLGGLLIQRMDGCVDFSHRLLRQALRSRYGSKNVAAILRYWFYFEPREDDSRQENMLVLARMVEELELDKDSSYQMDFTQLNAFFHDTIRDAGNLEENEDPEKAAEGTRQMDILKRSILSDLAGPEGPAHLKTYCAILDNAIQDCAAPNYFTIWFFGIKISRLLEQQGEAEKAMAIQIMCRILTSLHEQKKLYEAGEEKYAGNWTLSNKRRFLLYHSRTLRMISELRLSREQGLVRLGNLYGLSAASIMEKGLLLADECIREEPDDPIYHFRKASLYAYMAKALVGSNWGIGKSSSARYVEESMASIMNAVELARKRDERTRRNYRNNLLYISSTNVDTLISVYSHQLFGSAGILKYAEAVCERTWAVISEGGTTEELSIEELAHFKNAWGACLHRCAMQFKKRAKECRYKEINLRCDYYYSIRKDASRVLEAGAREQLARMAVEIGDRIVSGYMPEAMALDGYNRRTAAGFLVEKEGSYLQANARTDFDSRRRWGTILYVEAFYHSQVNPEQCVEACERALEVLTPLYEAAKKYSYAMDAPERWIKIDIDFMNKLLGQNREKLAAAADGQKTATP